jgi:hypothetical protein
VVQPGLGPDPEDGYNVVDHLGVSLPGSEILRWPLVRCGGVHYAGTICTRIHATVDRL